MGRIRSDRPANLAAREGGPDQANTGHGKNHSDDSAGGRDQHAGTGRDDDLNSGAFAVHTRYQHRDLGQHGLVLRQVHRKASQQRVAQ